jgi:Contractile injection system tube protein/LysM domain
MALEKAFIIPDLGIPISVLFNPTQYTLDRTNQIAEIGIPGQSAPLMQYVRGNARTLSMELMFDTYEEQTDVRVYTELVYGLLAINPITHAPPICTFVWGSFLFRCIVESASGRFTLFLSSGTPARATLTVSLKEYIDPDLLVRWAPTESADHTKLYTVQQGDTLSGIAAAEYGDPARWRPIADANRLANPRALRPGQLLVLPALKQPGGER